MIQISVHVLPQEIDQLEQLLIQLKYSSNYISPKDKVVVDVVLNLNLVDWDKSILPKKFFIDKFDNLKKLTQTWAETKFEINEDGTIQGCVSHRRKVVKETQSDAVLLLDTDIIFSSTLLFHFIHSINILKDNNPYYIVTPQTTPMWDNSWDIIVTDKYKNDGIHFQSRDPYLYAQCLENVNIKPVSGFKFGGGWATLISTPLLKHIGVPESLGHYGLEDTYIMICAQIMKQRGININQFVLENEIIVEDHLFRFNPYKNYLSVIDKREEFKRIAHNNFQEEINKFGNSLNN
jgi:hypothetical protein